MLGTEWSNISWSWYEICVNVFFHSLHLPWNSIANLFIADFQSRSGIDHFLKAFCITKYTTLNADISVEKNSLFLITFLITPLRDSITSVVDFI